MAILIGREERSNTPKRTQVFMATHDGEGNSLPLSRRSFISFSYGGVNIEDFNLIATIDGDRMSKQLYGNFNDITSDYDVVDGTFYWGTHFTNNQLNFTLSTDEISERDLELFKNWFRPGIARELVLAEHPNRGIMARVVSTPAMNMLPFEEKQEITLGNETTYNFSTTVYRGDINLAFTMDDPFWYSIDNEIELSDSEGLKVMMEDGIPPISSKEESIYYGDNEEYISVGPANSRQLYYCGSAFSLPVLSLKITPEFDNDKGYVIFPQNSITNPTTPYNYLQVGNKQFCFTTPGIWSGYNQALKIIDNFSEGDAVEELRIALRDNIYEYFAREAALTALNSVISENSNEIQFSSDNIDSIKEELKNLIFPKDTGTDTYKSGIFNFDSKTGEAVGYVDCVITDSEFKNLEKGAYANYAIVGESQATTPGNVAPDSSEKKVYKIKENVGDMVRSDYLIIENNNLKQSLKIVNNEIKLSYLDVKADHNIEVSLKYKHMYL